MATTQGKGAEGMQAAAQADRRGARAGDLPRILVIATGGTIASLDDGSGLAPALSGEDLVAFVPELAQVARISVTQPMNLDSTNVAPKDWRRMAEVVRENYDAYDGFVITHGTDTMAYTAAGLSYLIQDSGKPIVLTGSQLPMADPETDAKKNLFDAVRYAASPAAHDVSVVFAGKAICGTRARKQRTRSLDAFTSVNAPVLADLDALDSAEESDDLSDMMDLADLPDLNCPDDLDSCAASSSAARQPRFYGKLDERVFVLKLTPGLSPEIFPLLSAADYSAVVVEAFGLGGIPDCGDASLADAVRRWLHDGKLLVFATQVPEEGCDPTVYEVGRAFCDLDGVLLAGDMTAEAALAKTMWALGQARELDQVAELFYQPVNGDRS